MATLTFSFDTGTVIKNIVKNQDTAVVRATAEATVTPITLS